MTPLFPDEATNSDKYGPAMDITKQEKADEWLAACAEHRMRMAPVSLLEAELLERDAIAYYAGYFGEEVRLRVERLFKCTHPTFGSVRNGGVSMEDAYRTGLAIGKSMREPKVYGQNIHAPLIDVRHSELKRWSESCFKSCCPACKEGVLLVYRNPETFKLVRMDRCIVCGQTVRYLDDKIGLEAFQGEG